MMYSKTGYPSSANPNAINRYKTIGIETAEPGKLLIMLYDAAIGNCKKAKIYLEKGNMEAKGKAINKAQAILNEFIATLDYSVAPDLCANLESLYFFMIDQLSSANLNKDPKPIDTVIKLLDDLRSAWKVAVEQTSGAKNTTQL